MPYQRSLGMPYQRSLGMLYQRSLGMPYQRSRCTLPRMGDARVVSMLRETALQLSSGYPWHGLGSMDSCGMGWARWIGVVWAGLDG